MFVSFVIKIFFICSIAGFFTEADDSSKLSKFFYYMFMVCIHISNLTVLTRHIDNAYQSLQILKRRILDEYLLSSDDDTRHTYFYLLQRVEMLKPMSGDGYFEIGKTTITSMVSVRLYNLDHVSKNMSFTYCLFSITYIIILVQFQITAKEN